MKTYKTAKAILSHSLSDIEGGLWCKSHLAEYGTCTWENGYKQTISEDEVGSNLESAVSADLRDKPMGCALGLVSMYGGHGEEFDIQVNGCRLVSFAPMYPAAGNPSAGVVAAVQALFKALPKQDREEALEDGDNIDNWESAVYSYNDRATCTKARAAAWFRRALAVA